MYPPSSSPSSLPTKCCTFPSSSPPMTKSKSGLHTPSAANQSRKKATLPQPSKKVVIKLNKVYNSQPRMCVSSVHNWVKMLTLKLTLWTTVRRDGNGHQQKTLC
ncbi:hypothetical protein Bca4012_042620 [Brassica carinata]